MNFSSVPAGEIDVDAGLGRQRFRGAAQLVHPGRGVEVALAVDAHPVGAAARREVVVHLHVADGAVGLKVVAADQPRTALRSVGFDQVQRPVVGRDLDAVRTADVGRGENPRHLPRPVDAVDGGAIQLGEIQATLAVDGHVVGPDQRLAFVAVGEDLDLAGLQIGAGHPRRASHLDTGPLERRAFASDQPPLRVDQQPVGGVALLAVGREHAIGTELQDPLVDDVGEVDAAVAIDRGSFGEGDGGRDLGRLRRCRQRRRQATHHYGRREVSAGTSRRGHGQSPSFSRDRPRPRAAASTTCRSGRGASRSASQTASLPSS